MKISSFFDSRPAPEQTPARADFRNTTALDILARTLPADALKEVDVLLDKPQAAKMAMFACDLERLQASALLSGIPADAVACHALADLIVDAKTAFAELEESRKARTGPLRDEERRVNAIYGFFTGPLKVIREKADKLVLAYTQNERARVQREQDEQRRRAEEAARAEAAAVASAAAAKTDDERKAAHAQADAASLAIAEAQIAEPAAAPTAFKSGAGTVSVTKRFVLAGFDPDQIEAKYWRHPDVIEAVRKVLAADVRHGYRPAGCTIAEEESLRAR